MTLQRICRSVAPRGVAREIFDEYTRNIRIESRHKRAALGAREPGPSFISYARRIIVREQRGYKFPPFKFQIRFFPGNLGRARARARITFGAPLPALIGPTDRFGMECSTYFLSFARKNLPSRRVDLNNVAQFAPWWKYGKSTRKTTGGEREGGNEAETETIENTLL